MFICNVNVFKKEKGRCNDSGWFYGVVANLSSICICLATLSSICLCMCRRWAETISMVL